MQNLIKEYIRLGLPPDSVSAEEGFYYDWLLELKAQGFIDSIDLQPAYDLVSPVTLPFTKMHLTNKTNVVKFKAENFSVMQGVKYTPDFNVFWTKKAEGVFVFTEDTILVGNFNDSKSTMLYGESGTYTTVDDGEVDWLLTEKRLIFTCIEIKGTFASRQNSTAIKFPLLQKMMFAKHKVYVNKCQPFHSTKGVFCNTFTPKSYWVTPKAKKERLVKWTKLSLKDYLSNFKIKFL